MGRVAGRRVGEVLTHARRELLRDVEWYEDEFVHDHQRACGLDDFVYSVRVVGPARAGAVTATRGLRDRAFDAEDANLIALFHEELTRLSQRTPAAGGARLTTREREVRDRLLTGATEKAVAAALGISRETVHGYVKAIYAAHGVSSRAELLVKCLGGAPRSSS
jgi:DNA-binding CsgD family transcriptional regulator